MTATPVLGVNVDFASGASFGNPIILDDLTSFLDFGILADLPSDVVDISDIAIKVSIRRGRNKILDKFEAGSATIVIKDTNGDWNPSNVSSPYYGKLLPLRKIRIWADYDDGFGIDRYYIYSGYITSYDTNFALGLDEVSSVTLKCVDAFRLLTNTAITSVPAGIAGQYSGDRIEALLDIASWPNSLRDIDTGISTMQVDPGTDRGLLDAIQTVEQSEFGGFFTNPEGSLTFYSRDSVAKKADITAVDFSDNGVDIAYQAIDFAFDDTLLINDVTVTRLGGVAQNVQDATSITTYFNHSGKRENILVETDDEALSMATTILQARKDTNIRIDSMTLNLMDPNAVSRISAGLSLDLFGLVNITKTVPGGSSVTRELFVQGVNHDITRNTWTTQFITAEPIMQAFILDSATQGLLNSGILSY